MLVVSAPLATAGAPALADNIALANHPAAARHTAAARQTAAVDHAAAANHTAAARHTAAVDHTAMIDTTATHHAALADNPDPAAADNKLLLVFDSSGSMKEPDPAGTTKIDAARAAFTKLIPRLPRRGRVGLRVYGATIFDKHSPGACTDSQLAVPIGPADKPALAKAVSTFKPYGETPLSYSLQQGAKDLGRSGKRTILLVSDGEETCDPDPCATARHIAGLGIDLKIDVVGFRVRPHERKQLRCIAAAGSGTFYETDDAAGLASGLQRLSVRAFRPFRVTGRPVHGSARDAGAPVLTAGQYVDTAPGRGETKHYTIRRSVKGSTLHVGASARPAPGNAVAALDLQTKTPDGDSCGFGLGTAVSYARTNPVVTASASSWDRFTSYETDCQDSPELVVTVQQTESSGTTLDGVPIELVVVEEPPVTRKDDLPPPADGRPRWTPPPPTPADPVTPGASFSDAPPVGPGQYESSLFPGEVQFLKVHLGWGQRLEAEVDAPKPSSRLAALTDNPQVLEIALISPTRGKASATLSSVAGQDQTLVDDHGSARARTTTVDLRYANRDAGSQSQQSVAVPGDYFVALSLGEDREDQSYLLPVVVSVDVLGREGIGAPRYVHDRPLLVPGTDGRPVAFRARSDDAAGAGSDEAAERAAPSFLAPTGARGLAIVVLSGIVVALLLGAGVGALRRRGSRSSE